MLRCLKLSGAIGIALAAALSAVSPAKADIVANLGTLSAPETGVSNCLTFGCFSTGTSFGSLPAPGNNFTHQVHFSTDSLNAEALGGTLITPSNGIAVTSILLFLHTGGPTTVGAVNATGAFLAAATLESAGPPTAHWEFTFAPLLPEPASYFVEFIGTVLTSDAAYQQSINVRAVSAVPLPPAFFLFAAAVCGLVGYARVRHKKAAA